MAGRFHLLADTCVNDHLVQGLKARGWDVMRAVDLYPEATKDEVLFARAAAEGRVFVTNDRPAEAIAVRWLHEGTPFPGMIAWPVAGYETRSIGDLVGEFDSRTIRRSRRSRASSERKNTRSSKRRWTST